MSQIGEVIEVVQVTLCDVCSAQGITGASPFQALSRNGSVHRLLPSDSPLRGALSDCVPQADPHTIEMRATPLSTSMP